MPDNAHRLLIANSVADQLIAADGVVQFDLAVNPLSVVLINIRPLNDTGTLGNFQRYLGLCDAINRITIGNNRSNPESGLKVGIPARPRRCPAHLQSESRT